MVRHRREIIVRQWGFAAYFCFILISSSIVTFRMFMCDFDHDRIDRLWKKIRFVEDRYCDKANKESEFLYKR